MEKERRIELLEILLRTMISNIGYPVGCGLPPHPETIRKMADNCFLVSTTEDVA